MHVFIKKIVCYERILTIKVNFIIIKIILFGRKLFSQQIGFEAYTRVTQQYDCRIVSHPKIGTEKVQKGLIKLSKEKKHTLSQI